MIYLTKPRAEPPQAQIPHWTWNDIAKILNKSIKDRKKSNSNIPWISIQFLEWLKEEGVAYVDFNLNDLHGLQNFGTLHGKIQDCLKTFKESKLEKESTTKEFRWQLWFKPEKDEWGIFRWINEKAQLSLGFYIGYEDYPYISILIESDPEKPNREALLKIAHDAINTDPSELGKFKLGNIGWTITENRVPLVKLFPGAESCNLPFEEIHKWWWDCLEKLRNSGVLDKLKAEVEKE